MTIRRLFLVLAKLVGLLQIYWAFLNFMQIGFAISMFIRTEPPQTSEVLGALIGTVLYFCLSLGFAWLLLVQTEWVADVLKIQDNGELGVPTEDVILRTGMKLIGLYVTVHAVPGLTRALLGSRFFSTRQVGVEFWTKVLPAAIQLGLGCFLTFRSRTVLGWIAIKKE